MLYYTSAIDDIHKVMNYSPPPPTHTCTHTGDQIDAQYQEDMQEIVQLAGSPDSAFAMFHDVVKHLFEWDEQGVFMR